jgi:CRP/FNR family transcriptional regulator
MTFKVLFRDWKNIEEFDAQSIIFSERDKADVMFFVLSGEVELTLRGQPLGTESGGGIFGEMAMLESAVQNATATARTKARLARIDQEQLKNLISTNPDFSLHVMAVLANRLRAVDKYISQRIVDRE